MRSGFVAGDAALLKKFLLYRTYHGRAMSPPVQAASIAAWNDEAHVVENRALYREKFAAVTPLLRRSLDVAHARRRLLPLGRVRRWRRRRVRPRACYAQYNVTVLPGSYLARDAHGVNPGAGPHPHGARRRRSPSASKPRSASSRYQPSLSP